MWLNKFFEKIRAVTKAARETIPNQKRCEEFAADALKYCTKMYGAPFNSNKPYILIKGIGEFSSCGYVLGRYAIILSPGIETIEEQCMVIGHEMYHRFTMHRKGLRRQVWLDETLAIFTSLGFLQQNEFSDFADTLIENCEKSPGTIDLKRLRQFRRLPWYIYLRNLGPKYPDYFYPEIFRLAVALKAIVRSRDVYRIFNVASLNQWVDTLPEETRYIVCRILEISSDPWKPPENAIILKLFLRALKAKGDVEAAVAEFQTLAELLPTNGAVFAFLALAYVGIGDSDRALETYLKAFALGYVDTWVLSRIGGIYYLKKDYSSAIEWLQKADECDSASAKDVIRLGRSLNSLGYLREAHKAWEKILTMNEEKFKNLARQAIAENPLPGDEAASITPPESIPADKSLCAQS